MTEQKEIRITEENTDFRKQLMKTLGAERIMFCYQCGICTADCPVAKRVKEFRPRRIARLAVLGQKELLLGDDTIWLCAGCYTCYERCPEKVRVSEIVGALRNIAVQEGIIHPTYKALMNSIAEKGYIYEIDEFENEMRDEEGLPKAPTPAQDEINMILKKTGFMERVGGAHR
ncbi:MAG: 4Fe-4S dicluster domain-containing protein [Candidatus Bathyarchaeota archaeon]